MVDRGFYGGVPTGAVDVFKFFIRPRGNGFDSVVLTEGVGGVDDGDERTSRSRDVFISAAFPEDAAIRAASASTLAEDIGSFFFREGLIKTAAVRAGSVASGGGARVRAVGEGFPAGVFENELSALDAEISGGVSRFGFGCGEFGVTLRIAIIITTFTVVIGSIRREGLFVFFINDEGGFFDGESVEVGYGSVAESAAAKTVIEEVKLGI